MGDINNQMVIGNNGPFSDLSTEMGRLDQMIKNHPELAKSILHDELARDALHIASRFLELDVQPGRALPFKLKQNIRDLTRDIGEIRELVEAFSQSSNSNEISLSPDEMEKIWYYNKELKDYKELLPNVENSRVTSETRLRQIPQLEVEYFKGAKRVKIDGSDFSTVLGSVYREGTAEVQSGNRRDDSSRQVSAKISYFDGTDGLEVRRSDYGTTSGDKYGQHVSQDIDLGTGSAGPSTIYEQSGGGGALRSSGWSQGFESARSGQRGAFIGPIHDPMDPELDFDE